MTVKKKKKILRHKVAAHKEPEIEIMVKGTDGEVTNVAGDIVDEKLEEEEDGTASTA